VGTLGIARAGCDSSAGIGGQVSGQTVSGYFDNNVPLVALKGTEPED
jgi:hypothetical protein